MGVSAAFHIGTFVSFEEVRGVESNLPSFSLTSRAFFF